MDHLATERVLQENDCYRLIEKHGEEFVCFRTVKDGSLRDIVYDEITDHIDHSVANEYHNRFPVFMLSDYYFTTRGGMSGLITKAGNIGHKHGLELFRYLKDVFAKDDKNFTLRAEKGILGMSDVPKYFKARSEVIINSGSDTVAGVLVAAAIQWDWNGPKLTFSVNVLHSLKGYLTKGIYHFSIPGFMGVIPIKDLPIQMIKEEEKKELTVRGEKLVKMCAPGTYARYEGILLQPSWWMDKAYRADGRVVVDPISFARLEPNIWDSTMRSTNIKVSGSNETVTKENRPQIKEEDYWTCFPYLFGFSLIAKQWGRLELNGISEIQFHEDAFDRLVLEQESKDLIYSLVKYHGGGFTDFIEGKGGGCIFLLHGEPGLGKTASAEAVAEILHKPLYSVSVGELGTNTVNLEDSLRDILEVATIWDAVILLDEADIFLEARDEHDIERNAMVGVFLRLLEYHNGVLFLTTNRVKNIDKAFYSRISVALHFQDNGEAKREKIWFNLLGAAKLDTAWAKEMKGYDVNGRQIKNAIRLGQTLARADGDRAPQVNDFKRAIKVALKFAEDMTNSKSEPTTSGAWVKKA